MPSPAQQAAAENVKKSISKTPRKTGAKRTPGRPHKRLPTDKLNQRIAELVNKINVNTAKTTLLQDRLSIYERESTTRATEAEQPTQTEAQV